jgi:uncharacterized membrane protein
MSLDGLRAWIGEVERKLGMRTRVFLVLVAIAVGGASAALYLAVEAQEDSVSKADVQQVRDELAERIGTAGGETDLTQLEAELSALRGEVAQLKAEGGATKGAGGGSEGPAGKEAAGNTGTENPSSSGKKLLESLEKRQEEHGK